MVCRKKVAIVQSCYIPWKGYFDLMSKVDEFIFYDDIQFTRRDWRNRNMIKTPTGLQWLTIPVAVKGQYLQNINDTKISDPKWIKKHWTAIALNYGKSPYFNQYKDFIHSIYNECETEAYISLVNFKFIKKIAEALGIKTKISWSTDYTIDTTLKKTERLLALCQAANATDYLSGPSAKNYMQEDLFQHANINIEYMDYSGYVAYPQLFGDFTHTVTILDLIFNTGNEAYSFICQRT